jgi:hypothetical protein
MSYRVAVFYCFIFLCINKRDKTQRIIGPFFLKSSSLVTLTRHRHRHRHRLCLPGNLESGDVRWRWPAGSRGLQEEQTCRWRAGHMPQWPVVITLTCPERCRQKRLKQGAAGSIRCGADGHRLVCGGVPRLQRHDA